MDRVIARRLIGTTSVVLLLALGYLGLKWRYAPPPGSYTVEAKLGRAGSGLTSGSDVKARGVKVGSVESLRYEDAEAFAVLRLDAEPRLPGPDSLTLHVTAKTLLGEKQVTLEFPDDRFDQPPFLEPGDQLVASTEPTELQTVIDELVPFIEAMDSRDLGAIIDALGQQRGEGERIAENIRLGQELAAFADRTAEDNLRNLAALADVAEAIRPRAEDINRLNARIDEATRVLVERQEDVRRNLEALQAFSSTLGEFLRVEEDTISRLYTTGDAIGAVLERQAPHIGNLVDGLFKYVRELGHHGIDLNDGTEAALFRILIGGEEIDPVQILCEHAEDPPEQCPEPDEEGGA